MRSTDRRSFLKGALSVSGLVLAGAGMGFAEGLGPGAGARFLSAVVRGDLSAVEEGLARDPALVRSRDEEGRSAFAVALLHRHPAVADRLRSAGHEPDVHESALALDWERFAVAAEAEPGAVNLDHPLGGTAMYAAAVGGAGLELWRVYAQGGEPNAHPRKARGRSPLRAAFDEPDLATAELTAATLLSNGADPNLPEVDGDTPLHAAARRGTPDLVEMLIRKGAAPAARNRSGRTPLDEAERAGGTGGSGTAAMLRHPDRIPRDTDSSRRSQDLRGEPYRAADLGAFSVLERSRVVGIAHSDLDAVRDAVDRDPDLVHAVATTTEGAVEAAAHMGRTDIADLLLDRGAPYAIPTAVMRNDLDAVRRLLEEDPDRIRERGAHDFALLWYPVIGGGHRAMMELLLSRGAEVEAQHWLGTTALHYAAAHGDVAMAELLVDHGADVNRPGRKFGGHPLTPIEIAVQRKRDLLVAWLESRGARR